MHTMDFILGLGVRRPEEPFPGISNNAQALGHQGKLALKSPGNCMFLTGALHYAPYSACVFTASKFGDRLSSFLHCVCVLLIPSHIMIS